MMAALRGWQGLGGWEWQVDGGEGGGRQRGDEKEMDADGGGLEKKWWMEGDGKIMTGRWMDRMEGAAVKADKVVGEGPIAGAKTYGTHTGHLCSVSAGDEVMFGRHALADHVTDNGEVLMMEADVDGKWIAPTDPVRW